FDSNVLSTTSTPFHHQLDQNSLLKRQSNICLLSVEDQIALRRPNQFRPDLSHLLELSFPKRRTVDNGRLPCEQSLLLQNIEFISGPVIGIKAFRAVNHKRLCNIPIYRSLKTAFIQDVGANVRRL